MICSWLLHPGSRWMPNVCISSEIGSQWRTTLGHPQLIECMDICILSLTHGSEQRGFRRYLHIVKNWSGNFSLNSPRVRTLGWPLLGNFPGFFRFFWGGSVGRIIYREYIVFRSSNISCSLACTPTDRYLSVWFLCVCVHGMHLDWSIFSFDCRNYPKITRRSSFLCYYDPMYVEGRYGNCFEVSRRSLADDASCSDHAWFFRLKQDSSGPQRLCAQYERGFLAKI